jgi:hypothetical protein
MICMECLVDLLVLDLRFRNMREKIYRNVMFSLKYMPHFILKILWKIFKFRIYVKWLNH